MKWFLEDGQEVVSKGGRKINMEIPQCRTLGLSILAGSRFSFPQGI
jgi:hypothetical protein